MIVDFEHRFVVATCTKTGTNSLESALVKRSRLCFTVRPRHRMDFEGLMIGKRPGAGPVVKYTTCRHPLTRWCSGYAHHLRAPFWSALEGVGHVTPDTYAAVFFDKRETEREKSFLWTGTQHEHHQLLGPEVDDIFYVEEGGLQKLLDKIAERHDVRPPAITHVYKRKQQDLDDRAVVDQMHDAELREKLKAWCLEDCNTYAYRMPEYL